MEFFIIDNKGKISVMEIDEVKERVLKIQFDFIRIGYDVHLGFNFPDNSDLREILRALNEKQIALEMIGIDERGQSGNHPFSPMHVHCEIDGKTIRKKIFDRKSIFLSQIKCDREKIVDTYRFLSFEEKIKELISLVKPSSDEESLGEFLLKMHYEILKKQFLGSSNVVIKPAKYDRWNPITGKVHEPVAHKHHHILYIPLHKEQYERIAEKFKNAKKAGILGRKPEYIILPINTKTHFKKGGE
jgi:hypothetical protein